MRQAGHDSVEFKWIDGGHGVTPPSGFDNYFGAPPLYRFIDFDGVSKIDDILSKVRDLPQGLTAEDTMRSLVGDQASWTVAAVRTTLDRLFDIVDSDPEIDVRLADPEARARLTMRSQGILGYSEGATVAATFILEEQRRFEQEGRPRRINVCFTAPLSRRAGANGHVQCGIFFSGWPPLGMNNGSVQCLLADESDAVIDVPTFHIVGCNDPYIHGAMALFSMCSEDTATLFDHGKGHTVPRDSKTIEELASAVEVTWKRPAVCLV